MAHHLQKGGGRETMHAHSERLQPYEAVYIYKPYAYRGALLSSRKSAGTMYPKKMPLRAIIFAKSNLHGRLLHYNQYKHCASLRFYSDICAHSRLPSSLNFITSSCCSVVLRPRLPPFLVVCPVLDRSLNSALVSG